MELRRRRVVGGRGRGRLRAALLVAGALLLAGSVMGAGCGPLSFVGTWTVPFFGGISTAPTFEPTLTGAPPTYGFSMPPAAWGCFTQTCTALTVSGTATSNGDQLSISAVLDLQVFGPPGVPGTFTFTGTGVDTTGDMIADEATGTATVSFPDIGVDITEDMTITNGG